MYQYTYIHLKYNLLGTSRFFKIILITLKNGNENENIVFLILII